MAKLYNLARVFSATTGTGTITLGGAVPGYLTFALAGAADGETVAYGIIDGANSETGTGVYTASGTTLTRVVTTSTNGNAAISLTGNEIVYITARKEDMANVGETNSFSQTQTIPKVVGGTGTGSSLTLQSTSGVGATDTINLLVGNNGATTALSANTSGFIGINTPTPQVTLDVNNNTTKVPPAPVGGTVFRLLSPDASATTIELQNYGSTGGNTITGRGVGGTAASPTATPNSTILIGLNGAVYDGTNASNSAKVTISASQTTTSSAKGAQIFFETTPNGSTARATAVTFQASGGLSVGSSTDPGIGSLLLNAQFFAPNITTTAAITPLAILNNASSPANQLLRSTSIAASKRDAEPIEKEYADKILAMNPVWFKSAIATDRQDWSWYGLIAEEVAAVEPRMATWGYKDEDRELVETGKGVNGETLYESRIKKDAVLSPDGVAYERLSVLLLAKIQEYERRIAALENKT